MTSPFPFRRLRCAWNLFRAARKADGEHHMLCRECGYELSDAEAYYSRDEQERLFGAKSLVLRYPKKDCPSCGAKHTAEPFYEPLYGLPPREMCVRLAWGELKDALLVRTLYAYPQGHGGAQREVIRQFWGRDISRRLEANPRA